MRLIYLLGICALIISVKCENEDDLVTKLVKTPEEGSSDDQPTSGEQFLAIHKGAVGTKEQLRPTLMGLEALAVRFLPKNYVFQSVIEATREIVAGVRFELLVNALDENQVPTVCYIQILERPWIKTEWGDKQKTLLYSNCTQTSNNDDDVQVTEAQDPNKPYEIHPIFDDSKRSDVMTDEGLKALEDQIISGVQVHEVEKPKPINVVNTEESVSPLKLSDESASFLDSFFNSGPNKIEPPKNVEPINADPDSNNDNNSVVIEETVKKVFVPNQHTPTVVDDTSTLNPSPSRTNVEEFFDKFIVSYVTSLANTDDIYILSRSDVKDEFKRLLKTYSPENEDKTDDIVDTSIHKVLSSATPTAPKITIVNANSKSVSDGISKHFDEYVKTQTHEPVAVEEVDTSSTSTSTTTTTPKPVEDPERERQMTALFNDYMHTALKNSGASIKDIEILTDDDVIKRQFTAIMHNFDEQMARMEDGARPMNDETSNKREVNGSSAETSSSEESVAVVKTEKVNSSSSENSSEEVVARVKRSTDDDSNEPLSTHEILAKVLYELDRIDSDDHKRVVLDIFYLLKLKNFTEYQIRIGSSECVENDIYIEDCKNNLIRGTEQFCAMEVHINKRSVQVQKSECAPINYRKKRGIKGGIKAGSNLTEATELIQHTLSKLNGLAAGENGQFELVRVSNYTKQVVSGSLFRILAVFKHTNTGDNTVNDAVFCNIRIWDQPWLPNGQEVTYDCNNEKQYNFKHDSPGRSKRSPKGNDYLIKGGKFPGEDITRATELVEGTLVNLNGYSDDDDEFKFIRVINYTQQIVAGTLYSIVAEFKTVSGKVKPEKKVVCTVDIWDQPWLDNGQDVKYDCENEIKYNFQQDSKAKREKRQLGGISPGTDNESAAELVKGTLPKLNGLSSDDGVLEFIRVVNYTHQVVSGSLYRINAEFKVSFENGKSGKNILCAIKIWDQPWLENGQDVTYECEDEIKYNFQQNSRAKRSLREKRQVRVGGVSPGTDNESAVELVKGTLPKLNGLSSDDGVLEFIRVVNYTHQVVSGSLYRINAEFKVSFENGKSGKNILCAIEIWDQPWLENGQDVKYECEDEIKYNFQQNSRAKRSLREQRQVRVGGVSPGTDNESAVELVKGTLPKLNGLSSDDGVLEFIRVVNYTHQVVSGSLYKINAEFKVSFENGKSGKNILCAIKIWDQPWLENGQDVTYECEDEIKYNFQQNSRAKRSLREKRQVRVGGVSPGTDNESAVELVKGTLPKLNGLSSDDGVLEFIRVVNYTHQVVSGSLYRINAEFKVSFENGKSGKNILCAIEIWDQPWLENGQDVKYECEDEIKYNFQQNSRAKRSLREKRQVRVGGVSPGTDNESAAELVKGTLPKLNGLSSDDGVLEFIRVVNYTHQVVSGSAYKIYAEFKVSSENDKAGKNILCLVDIWDQSWLENGQEVKYDCEDEVKYNFKQNSPSRNSRRKRDVFVGGQTPIESEDDLKEVKNTLESSLTKLNGLAEADGGCYKLKSINNATVQLVAGTIHRIHADFDHCSKSGQVSHCYIEIWERSWLPEDKQQIEFHCDGDKLYQFRQSRSIHDRATSDETEKALREIRDDTLDTAMATNKYTDVELFTMYKLLHEKNYENSLEHSVRLRIFKHNLGKIRDLQKYEQGTAVYGITEFADMTTTEYRMRTGLLTRKDNEYHNNIGNAMAEIPDFKLPTEFDWRTKGAVSSVKNQGSCGSCWAFSVIGNIEGLHAVKTGVLEEYSEQELLDCDTVDSACNGGLPDDAYKAIEQIGGLELESEYPYKAKKGSCAFDKSKSHVQLSGAVDLPKNETAMALWLIANGPISIGINANAMQFYRGGVSHPWKMLCNKNNLDHGVLIVGFGVHNYPKFNKVLPYWIVKNSWGPSWGEQGYYRVFRGDNTCGVSNMASSAVLE